MVLSLREMVNVQRFSQLICILRTKLSQRTRKGCLQFINNECICSRIDEKPWLCQKRNTIVKAETLNSVVSFDGEQDKRALSVIKGIGERR